MARLDEYAPGQFSWVDLMSRDAEASRRFYGELFGCASRSCATIRARPSR